MTGFLVYLLEASLCLSLFYAIYLLLIRNDTFYRLKRFYLLAAVVFSLIIPQLPSTVLPEMVEMKVLPDQPTIVQNEITQDVFGRTMLYKVTPQPVNYNPDRKSVGLLAFVLMAYVLGAGYMVFRMIIALSCIFNLTAKQERRHYKGISIIALQDDFPTFSFFKTIYLNRQDAQHEDASDILAHEETHINQRHSIDILFLEICKVLFWFNPVIWQYKKLLLQVHECLADQQVVQAESGKADHYKSLLLRHYIGNINVELVHPFNHLSVQYRLKMMAKTKSKRWFRYKLVLAMPILFFTLLFFTNCPFRGNSGNDLPNDYQQDSTAPFKWGTNYLTKENGSGIEPKVTDRGIISAFIQSVATESQTETPYYRNSMVKMADEQEFRGQRVKMTGHIKMEGVADTAMMWVRIDGSENGVMADFDIMFDKPVLRTRNQTRCEIVFDVPNDECTIFYGFIFRGKGKAWYDNVTFEIVEPTMAKSEIYKGHQIPKEYVEQMSLISNIWYYE